jgi:hypothetical protein
MRRRGGQKSEAKKKKRSDCGSANAVGGELVLGAGNRIAEVKSRAEESTKN